MKVEKLFLVLLLLAASAFAEGGYTNHAGNVVAGWPVKLTQKDVTLSEGFPDSRLSPTNLQNQTSNIQSPASNIQHQTSNSQLSTSNSQLSTFNSQLSTTYPLSIFPESEQRRIAADFVIGHGGGQVGLLRVPDAVKRAVAGAEKAMARSRRRAAKGLCTQEESEAFCAKSEAALKSYLDKQVEKGVVTPAERKAIGH